MKTASDIIRRVRALPFRYRSLLLLSLIYEEKDAVQSLLDIDKYGITLSSIASDFSFFSEDISKSIVKQELKNLWNINFRYE